VRVWLTALSLAAALGCTQQTLQPGHYVLTLRTDGGPQDACHLYSGGLGASDLSIAGIDVYMNYSLDGLVLEGQFAAPVSGQPDEFETDGTVNTPNALVHVEDGGTFSCPADSLNAHLTGTVSGPHAFTGLLTLTYSISNNASQDPGCYAAVPATCELSAGYIATASP
jgi:hypothetical protein